MVRRALFIKSINDMQKSKAQFISIFIMAMLAVATVTGLDSLWKTIDDHSGTIYAATDVSDIWVHVASPTEKELWSIARIEGVEKVEKRFSLKYLVRYQRQPYTPSLYLIKAEYIG